MNPVPDPLDRLATTNGADVADVLRLAILDGTLEPGTRLLQPHVAQSFGTSRTPVREALHKLHAWGLVDLVANRTAVVRRVRRDHYANAFVVWAELGALAAELATKHGQKAIDQLGGVVREEWAVVEGVMASDRSPPRARERWLSAQRIFHGELLDASGSARLRETVGTATELVRWETIWKAVEHRPYRLRSFVLRHEEIAVLIRRKDAEGAADCMRRHIFEMSDAFLAWFDRNTSERDGYGEQR